MQHTEQYKHLHKYTLHSIIYTCTYNSIYPLYRIHAPLTTYVPTTHSIQYPLPNIPTHTSSHVHMDTHVIPLYTSHPTHTHLTTWTSVSTHVLYQSYDLQSHLATELDLFTNGIRGNVLGRGHYNGSLGITVQECLNNSQVFV